MHIIGDHAVMLNHCTSIDNAVLADDSIDLYNGHGAHQRPGTDFCGRINNSGRMNKHGPFCQPPIKTSQFLANRITAHSNVSCNTLITQYL